MATLDIKSIKHMINVRPLLEKNPIITSAPCRVDSGGTWDIKAMALPMEHISPTTINLALNLRTKVILGPYREGMVQVSSKGFPEIETHSIDNMAFTGPFGLFLVAISIFRFHGISVHIVAGAPPGSSLGGSSTALIALIWALSKLSKIRGQKQISKRRLLKLSHEIEDGVFGGYCGMQDHGAAIWGGINRWHWRYNKGFPTRRELLLNKKDQKELFQMLLVAYCGESHFSAEINRRWVRDFLSSKTKKAWIEVNHVVHELGDAIKMKKWETAISLLKEEMKIRKKITPDALIPITEKMINDAEKNGCGARFAGAGAGGSVWAMGMPDRIQLLKKAWSELLNKTEKGKILPALIDHKGVE